MSTFAEFAKEMARGRLYEMAYDEAIEEHRLLQMFEKMKATEHEALRISIRRPKAADGWTAA